MQPFRLSSPSRFSVALASVFYFACSLFFVGSASAVELRDFTSDGCSLFPDGSVKDRALWCDCCLAHDITYWRGGTREDRKRADEVLRDCVLARTGSKALANLMYDGVRVGGDPAFPAWYRWGYGWKYGKGYSPLTAREKQEVRRKLKAYHSKHPTGYCREQHGGKK
jgi:hypothetical protein